MNNQTIRIDTTEHYIPNIDVAQFNRKFTEWEIRRGLRPANAQHFLKAKQSHITSKTNRVPPGMLRYDEVARLANVSLDVVKHAVKTKFIKSTGSKYHYAYVTQKDAEKLLAQRVKIAAKRKATKRLR